MMYRTVLWISLGSLLSACATENGLVPDEYEDPLLRLETPSAASWMSDGTAMVYGTALHLDDVTVNDAPATLDGDTFTTEIELTPGINFVEARGLDMRGDALFVRHGVLAGEFADPPLPVDDAVIARVNEPGLDHMTDMVSDMITVAEIEGALAGFNPVYQDSYGILGWDAVSIRADITEVWFAQVAIDATPKTDLLTVDVTIPDFFVGLNASGDIVGWDFGVDAWMWADYVDITADVTVGVENGKLTADLVNPDISLVGFGYDTSLIPGEIETYILVDVVRGFIEDMLVGQVEEMVPPLIEEQLAGLEIAFETELLERTVSIEGEFASATIDPDGLQVGLDLDVRIPGEGVHTYAGYLSNKGGIAQPDRTHDLGLSMADDTLNRVLFEAWRSGMLSMTMSTEDGSLEPAMLAMLKAEEGQILIDAKLPPVIVESEGGLQAQLGELEITIETPGGELGNFITLSVAVFVDLQVKVHGGELELALGEPVVEMVVRDSDWGASNEATTTLLEEMLPISIFTDLIGDLEFPLPSLAGISINRADVEREPNGSYTGVEVTLQ